MENCVFCQIIEKQAPAKTLFEGEEYIIIKRLVDLAPVHLLVIPRQHFASLNDLTAHDTPLAGRLLFAARHASQLAGIQDGYRTIINTGSKGGQTIFHLHIHVLGGGPVNASLIAKGLG